MKRQLRNGFFFGGFECLPRDTAMIIFRHRDSNPGRSGEDREYPNQLDYSGSGICSIHTYCRFSSCNCSACQMHQPRIGPMLAWQTRFVIPGNGVRKSPRKKTIRNVISFYIRNHFFCESVCKTKICRRGKLRGPENASSPPRAGAGFKKSKPARSAKNFFLAHWEEDPEQFWLNNCNGCV